MYKNYFGFSDSPFENNLDQRFLFFSASHKEVAASLLYFIKWKKSFAMVCGDVGTGKTMLINYLLNKLPDSLHPVMISNPDVGYNEILRYLAGILKIDVKGKRILDIVDHVKVALVEAGRLGKRFVLIIDEAQLLSDKSIEQIRLLSNIETQEHKLFQILLLGQYELSHKLNRPEMRQLRQRININRFLAPMDSTETIQYIDHRLQMAGSSFDACFESNCMHPIFKMTNGVPRSINQLCDSALLVCKAEKRRKVNRNILEKANAALQSDILFTPISHAGNAPTWKKLKPLAAFGACAIIAALFGIFGYGERLGEKAHYFLGGLYSSMPASPAALQQPASDAAVNSGIPSSTIKPAYRLSSKPPDFSIKDASETDITSRISLNSVPPMNEKKNQDSDSEADSQVIKQPVQNEVHASQPKEFGVADGSPPTLGKDFQTEKQVSLLHDSKRFVVKKGDTLIGIASKLYPMNKSGGLKTILAANPMIDNINLIIAGQELIIPEPGAIGKDVN